MSDTPKVIVQPFNIILAKIITGLDLDKDEGLAVARVLYTMRVAVCDIDRSALFY